MSILNVKHKTQMTLAWVEIFASMFIACRLMTNISIQMEAITYPNLSYIGSTMTTSLPFMLFGAMATLHNRLTKFRHKLRLFLKAKTMKL